MGTSKCRRGSDWAAPGQRLVLVKSESDGHWTDWDVDKPYLAEITGIPVFLTYENPIEEGEHRWQVDWNRSRASPEWGDMDTFFLSRHQFPEEVYRFRIGAMVFGYIYNRLDENTWLCQRGSDWAVPGQTLVLKKSESEGHWADFDCVNGVDETETTGIPVFRTFENPIVEGEHHWQVNWNRSRASPEWRDMEGVFMSRHQWR